MVYVNANGEPINPFQTPSALAPKAKPKRVKALTGIDYEDTASLGFVVEGFTRAMLDAAADLRMKEIASYPERLEQALADHKKTPLRPQPWDEEQYLLTAKPARVRSRPYEIRAAADECRALAERMGWMQVRVTELRRQRKG